MSFWVSLLCRICSPGADDHQEFDFRVLGDGRSASARYANNSNYRNDSLIRKESKFCSKSPMRRADMCSVCERCTSCRD